MSPSSSASKPPKQPCSAPLLLPQVKPGQIRPLTQQAVRPPLMPPMVITLLAQTMITPLTQGA